MRYLRKLTSVGPTSLLILFLSMVSIVSVSPKVQAHVLQSNNGVSAVLHIVPDDDPVAGVATTAGLQFSSTISDFNLDQYSVSVALRGTSTTASVPPTPLIADGPASLYGTVEVNFPEPGSYDLVVEGKPVNGGRPFTLTFEIRAEQPSTGGVSSAVKSGGFDSIILGIASFGLLLIIARYQIMQGGRYSGRHKEQGGKQRKDGAGQKPTTNRR